MATDVGFPILRYEKSATPLENGRKHGEDFRTAIHELAAVRNGLLRAWNPGLKEERISKAAILQWEAIRKYDAFLHDELKGIAEGADLSVQDLVVLNNYTDFRDLRTDGDQGCSTVYWEGCDRRYAGQTWDMHRSARNYLCVIDIPSDAHQPGQLVMSLVGCVGLMGYNSHGAMVGVNNLNMTDAVPGVLWPAVVRQCLRETSAKRILKSLFETSFTSGRNFLIADKTGAQMWEMSPSMKALAAEHKSGSPGFLFHTNHCWTDFGKKVEDIKQTSPTTKVREDVLRSKLPGVRSPEELFSLLSSHDGYPNSLCFHVDSVAKDPSETCGGALGDLDSFQFTFWRGCDRSEQPRVERRLEFRQ